MLSNGNSKKGSIFIDKRILVLVIIIIICGCFFLKNDVPRDEVTDQDYVNTCKTCCDLFSEFPILDIHAIQTDIENTRGIFLIASTGYYLMAESDIILSLSDSLSIYLTYSEFIDVFKKILPEYNEIIKDSQRLIQQNKITYKEAEDFFEKVGEFSGKVIFSIYTADIYVLEEFIEEIYHLSEAHGIKDKLSELFDYEELEGIKEIVRKAYSSLDEKILSRIEVEHNIGELFSILVPKTIYITSKSKNVLRSEITQWQIN